jgi:Superfamily II helicase
MRCKRIRSSRNSGLRNTFWARLMFSKVSLPSFKCHQRWQNEGNELILRSAFLAERVSLAIIIAPFRALCHEIKNSLVEAFHNEPTKVDELSDALQTDFEIAELLGHQQILVVTPEKLLYVLRHAPELAAHIGLLVFDEGHQFDSGTRGITYELLLTSLRSMIPKELRRC